MTVDEFLRLEGEPDHRYELLAGEPVAMAPAAGGHRRIVLNLAAEIDRRLESKTPCRLESEAGIQISATEIFVPDLAATCRPSDRDVLMAEPFLIVEVLSPSTRSHDLGRKLDGYKELSSVSEIWLIDSERRWVQIWTRETPGWVGRDHVGGGMFESAVLADRIEIERLYRNTAI